MDRLVAALLTDSSYIFFDERYEHEIGIFCNLIVSAILVSQSQYEFHIRGRGRIQTVSPRADL